MTIVGMVGRFGTCALITALSLSLSACAKEKEGESTNDAKASETAGGAPSTPTAPRAENRSLASSNPSHWPPIEFEPAVLDLGFLSVKQRAEGPVRIWNVGDKPLEIVKANPSCGCTSVDDLAGRVIQPGQYTEFIASMEGKQRTGLQQEGVQLVIKGYTQSPLPKFPIKAEIVLPVRSVPPFIDAERATQGEVYIQSMDGQPFRILASHGGPPDLVGFDPDADEPRNGYKLRWDVSPMAAAGDVPWFWVIETDRPGAEVVDIRIRHGQTAPRRVPNRPWQGKQQRLLVGNVEAGAPFKVRATIEYNGGVEPNLTGALMAAQSTGIEARLDDVTVDGQYLHYEITITPRVYKKGLFYEKLTLFASGFQETVRIIGRME